MGPRAAETSPIPVSLSTESISSGAVATAVIMILAGIISFGALFRWCCIRDTSKKEKEVGRFKVIVGFPAWSHGSPRPNRPERIAWDYRSRWGEGT